MCNRRKLGLLRDSTLETAAGRRRPMIVLIRGQVLRSTMKAWQHDMPLEGEKEVPY